MSGRPQTLGCEVSHGSVALELLDVALREAFPALGPMAKPLAQLVTRGGVLEPLVKLRPGFGNPAGPEPVHKYPEAAVGLCIDAPNAHLGRIQPADISHTRMLGGCARTGKVQAGPCGTAPRHR